MDSKGIADLVCAITMVRDKYILILISHSIVFLKYLNSFCILDTVLGTKRISCFNFLTNHRIILIEEIVPCEDVTSWLVPLVLFLGCLKTGHFLLGQTHNGLHVIVPSGAPGL